MIDNSFAHYTISRFSLGSSYKFLIVIISIRAREHYFTRKFMRLILAFGVLNSASASVASYLPERTKVQLLAGVLEPELHSLDPLVENLRHILGDDTRQIVLEDFLIESDMNKFVSMIIYRNDIQGVMAKIIDDLPRFLDKQKTKCMYWSLPKMYRLRYDELIDRNEIDEISKSSRHVPREWAIPSEGKFLADLSHVYMALSYVCRPLHGPYVACGEIVFDLDNECSISFRSQPPVEPLANDSQTFTLFLPHSRAVVETDLRNKKTETVTLYKGESEPRTFTITHLRDTYGPPISFAHNNREVNEAPLRIFYHPDSKGGYEKRYLETDDYERTYDIEKGESIAMSTIQGFVKNKQYDRDSARVKPTEMLLFGNGKVLILYSPLHGQPPSSVAVYSYTEWESLPIEDRFVRYEDVPLPSLYLKQDLVNEVEHVALFTSMKRPPYFYERRYPRLFREGKSGWLNKDDIQQFETLKNAVDKYLQSESFKSELEADWTDGFIMPILCQRYLWLIYSQP